MFGSRGRKNYGPVILPFSLVVDLDNTVDLRRDLNFRS